MLAEAAGTAEIPNAVATVIEGALSKDPARRPQTMLEFADELRAALQSLPSPKITRLRGTRNMLLALGTGVALGCLATPSTTCPPPGAAAMALIARPADPENVAPVHTHVPTIAMEPVPQATEPPPAEDASMLPMPDDPGNSSPPVDPGDNAPPVDPDDSSPPVDTEVDPDDSSPSVDPANNSAPKSSDRRGASTRTAYRRALAGRSPEVQECAKVAAGGLDELTVAVHIETSGRVSARIVGEPETPLGRCVDAVLRRTPVVAPSVPVTFRHTFTLRPTPHQP